MNRLFEEFSFLQFPQRKYGKCLRCKDQDDDNGNGLCPDAIAHDLVRVLAVELAALRKAADADHQDDQHGQNRDRDKNEKRVSPHKQGLSVGSPCDLAGFAEKAND